MHNLASVNKKNEVGLTSCCNAPIKVATTGDFFVCKSCGTEVTLVPEFAELSPQEKLMKQKAIANKNKAKQVPEDTLDHIAKICISDISEVIELYVEEQYQYYLDVDITISPAALLYLREIYKDNTKRPIPMYLMYRLYEDQTFMDLMFNQSIGELSTKAQVDKHALAKRVYDLEKNTKIKKALHGYIQS